MTDVPVTQLNQSSNEQFESAYHQEAPWSVKRMLLARDLSKQTLQNKRSAIDTSVIVHDITDNRLVFSYNGNYEHYAASISKLFVTSLLLEDLNTNKISLDTVISWTASDRRAGAGKFDSDNSPLSATVREVLFDMLNQSGNTAVRAIVNKTLGGANKVNERYVASYPLLKVTKLIPVSETGFLLGYTTAKETDFILKHLYGQTNKYAAFVKNALATNIFDTYGPRSQVKDKTAITVIDKQGQLNDPEGNNRHDVGIIENSKNGHKLRYVLMTTNYEQPAGLLTAKAESSLKQFGLDMLRFEGDKMPAQTMDRSLQLAPEAVRPPLDTGRTIY